MEGIIRPLPSALLFATLALLTVPAALAHPHSGPEPQRRFMLKPSEARQVYGTYELSNGDLLKVGGSGRQHWAEMARTGRIEIVPVNWYQFVEKGGHPALQVHPVRVPGRGNDHRAG